MRRVGPLGKQLRSLLWKASVEEEVDAEFAFHVEMRTRELIDAGMPPDAAQREAVRRFGDFARVHATCRKIGTLRDREMQRAEYLQELRQDFRYALRQLGRTPGFTAVAAITLALGIGASTAIFSAVDAVVLRPLPFREPERLVHIQSHLDANDESMTSGNFIGFREESRSFSGLAALEYVNQTLVDGDRAPQQLAVTRASAEYFALLGISAELGRFFRKDEDVPGRDGVVVLSHELWASRFNGDRGVLGRPVDLNGIRYEVIGVAPPSVTNSLGPPVDVFVPIAFTPAHRDDFRKGYLDVVARLAPGVTIEQARQEMVAIAKRLEQRMPRENEKRTAVVRYLRDDLVGDYPTRLFVLLGAVGLVLLIACGNVANLLLARGAGRRKEIAIRAALGAGRGRVIRQLLTESLVLALVGGLAGLGLAALGVRALKVAGPGGVPRLDEAGIDGMALAFALAITVAASFIFGLAPALRSSHLDLQSALKEGGRGSSGGVRDRMRQALVVTEVALSLVLLVGAGLLIRSAIQLQRVEPGFDPRNVYTGWMSLPATAYATPERVAQAYEQVMENVKRVPGVEDATVISVLPMIGVQARGGFGIEGRPLDRKNAVDANVRLAGPGVFRIMRIPMRQGRDFSEADDAKATHVVIINEAYAKQAWPNESAIGKRVVGPRDSAGAPTLWEVVGIVGNTREDGLREDTRPAIFWPLRQVPPILWDAMQRSMFIIARTHVAPMTVAKGVESAVMRVDRTLPVFNTRSMEDRMRESLATQRFNTMLLAVLGVIGLALASVGIYGVIAYFVSQRTQEIGVRMALGATPRSVLRLVVGQGMRPVLLGVLIGAAGSLAAVRVLAAQVYGVKITDPLTFVGVAGVLIVVALLASAIPARRASKVDPKEALTG